MTQRFEYGVSRIKDFEVQTIENSKGQTVVSEMLLEGRSLQPTNRFWNSLHLRFGFTSNIFRYFRHDEVFKRISKTTPNDRVRWCIEWNEDKGRLLAVTNPTTGLIPHDDLLALLKTGKTEKTTYSEGVVSSTHAPRLADTFAIAGDDFQNKFVINAPIDGFGRPQVYLSLLRLICSNGAVGCRRQSSAAKSASAAAPATRRSPSAACWKASTTRKASPLCGSASRRQRAAGRRSTR